MVGAVQLPSVPLHILLEDLKISLLGLAGGSSSSEEPRTYSSPLKNTRGFASKENLCPTSISAVSLEGGNIV